MLDIRSFGVNAYVAEEPGVDVIGEHDEVDEGAPQHEELYFVSEGHATFTVNGDEIDAPAGTFVFVRDPAATRKAVATEAGTTVLVIGSKDVGPNRAVLACRVGENEVSVGATRDAAGDGHALPVLDSDLRFRLPLDVLRGHDGARADERDQSRIDESAHWTLLEVA